MTNNELNRDIKRLMNQVDKKSLGEEDNATYFKWIEDYVKPEYLRLYGADKELKAVNLQSLKILIHLNQRFRFVPFHQFGLYIQL